MMISYRARRHGCRLLDCLALLSKRCFQITQNVPSVQQMVLPTFPKMRNKVS